MGKKSKDLQHSIEQQFDENIELVKKEVNFATFLIKGYRDINEVDSHFDLLDDYVSNVTRLFTEYENYTAENYLKVQDVFNEIMTLYLEYSTNFDEFIQGHNFLGLNTTQKENLEIYYDMIRGFKKDVFYRFNDFLEQHSNLLKNDFLNQTTTQPTPPQKEIEYQKPTKIDWKKDERLIPYLIHLLNESGYIKEKNQFAFIEKYFTANGKPIKRENIKANYNQADYLNKPINKSPKEIKQINDIIEQLNNILDALE